MPTPAPFSSYHAFNFTILPDVGPPDAVPPPGAVVVMAPPSAWGRPDLAAPGALGFFQCRTRAVPPPDNHLYFTRSGFHVVAGTTGRVAGVDPTGFVPVLFDRLPPGAGPLMCHPGWLIVAAGSPLGAAPPAAESVCTCPSRQLLAGCTCGYAAARARARQAGA